MPAFPGAQSTDGLRGERARAQASADSRPPPPTSRTLIERSVTAAGAGAAAPGRGLLLLSGIGGGLVRGGLVRGGLVRAALPVTCREPATPLELEGGPRDQLLEPAPALGTLRQRLVVELLERLEGVPTGFAAVLVERHDGWIVEFGGG